MASRRKPGPKPRFLRSGRILTWEGSVGLSTMHSLDGKFERFDTRGITLTAELLEPLKGQTKVTVYALSEPAHWGVRALYQETSGVAYISAIKKQTGIEVVAHFNDAELSTLLQLACSNQLRSLSFSCAEPNRGRAEISSIHLYTIEAESIE